MNSSCRTICFLLLGLRGSSSFHIAIDRVRFLPVFLFEFQRRRPRPAQNELSETLFPSSWTPRSNFRLSIAASVEALDFIITKRKQKRSTTGRHRRGANETDLKQKDYDSGESDSLRISCSSCRSIFASSGLRGSSSFHIAIDHVRFLPVFLLDFKGGGPGQRKMNYQKHCFLLLGLRGSSSFHIAIDRVAFSVQVSFGFQRRSRPAQNELLETLFPSSWTPRSNFR